MRQGCALSSIIFALLMEPLAEHIRTSPLISGIKVDDTQHKTGLYTDDLIIFLSDPLYSLPPLCQLLDHFGTLSLYIINYGKCRMLPSGLTPTTKHHIERDTALPPFAMQLER